MRGFESEAFKAQQIFDLRWLLFKSRYFIKNNLKQGIIVGIMDDIEETIRKYSLQNALKYSGKATQGAVVGKVLAENPELKKDMGTLGKQIADIIADVNKLSVEQQKEEIENLAPELLEKKKPEKRNIFAFLGINEKDAVVTAFPPEPSKYPHIGHAKAILLNYELAKQHKGKFILRFEDTNPELAKKEFYDIHIDNYKWLGIKWDKLIYVSDYMKDYYRFAEKLIKEGNAYMCTCEPDKIKDNRMKRKECSCRKLDKDENLNLWNTMPKMGEGQAILRLKADMKSDNSTMRDPALIRIIKKPHPRLGEKFVLWPTYDFENSIMDALLGVTHRLRSKEFELRNELQRFIQEKLGLAQTSIYEFARFNLEGVESSGRVIREKIENGELIGWDDPTLTTLVALKRRGFVPEAIKNFVLSTGISKAEATLTWDDLIMHNKRLLDREAKRYFFIGDAVDINIENHTVVDTLLKYHPADIKHERKFKIDGDFIIEKSDYEILEDGKLYRLMDCLNFRKDSKKFVFDSANVENYKKEGEKIIHWLPKNDNLVDAEVLMPDKKVINGKLEKNAKNIKVGSVVQFERFGFCRLDKKEKDKFYFWYTHK